jgi:integrase
MARVKDLWYTTGTRGQKRKTARHPDNGGDPDARRWLAIYAGPDGRERTKAFANQKRAVAYVAKMAADIERGEWMDPALGRGLIDPLAGEWLSLHEVSAASRQRYESCYKLHIKPVFGHRQAGSVKPSEVVAWSASLAKHRATRQLALMIISGVFDLAVADGVRRDNPARSPVVGRADQFAGLARVGWDAARVRGVARGCGDYETVPLVIAGLGLRECEGFGLSPDDFDFDAGTVRIRRQLVRYGSIIAAKLPKGGKERTVPVPRGVAEVTERWIAAHQPGAITLPWLTEDGAEHGTVSFPLLFRFASGRHIQAWEWSRRCWFPALAAAGVIPEYEGRKYPPAREHGMHVLRHWYSSCLQDAGVSLAGVMEFLGHSRKSAPLAVGIYGHVTDATFDAARRAVDSSLFALRPVQDHGTATELRRAR